MMLSALSSRLVRVAYCQCHTVQPFFGITRSRSLTTSSPSSSTTNQTNPLQGELPGTVPPHKCYVFLHTPNPPATYPAKFSTPVQRALLRELIPVGGSVNFCWSENGPSYSLRPPGEEDLQEYYLTAFSSKRGKIEVPTVSMKNVGEVGSMLRQHVDALPSTNEQAPVSDDVHLYVCTHMARDCRCGNTGSAVASTFRKELQRRRERGPRDPAMYVKIAETAHVGGHKYAANVLIYPHGEWLGLVKPEDVPNILDTIVSKPFLPIPLEERPICPPHWRGRMGLDKEAQLQLVKQHWVDESGV